MNASQRLIERAGGYKKLADMLGIAKTTAQYWWEAGVIPRKKQSLVMNALREHGVEVDPIDFLDLTDDSKLKDKKRKPNGN
jgi:hypothetical protein